MGRISSGGVELYGIREGPETIKQISSLVSVSLFAPNRIVSFGDPQRRHFLQIGSLYGSIRRKMLRIWLEHDAFSSVVKIGNVRFWSNIGS